MTKIFMSTLHDDPNDEYPNTGDTDYVTMLCKLVESYGSSEEPIEACYLKGKDTPGVYDKVNNKFDGDKAIDYIIENTPEGQAPILNLMINYPTTGFGFSVEQLERFKELGGKLIITSFEFYKHTGRTEENESKSLIMKYMTLADEVVHLDDKDKESAILYAEKHGSTNENLIYKLKSSQVIYTPSTIEVESINDQFRGNDIVSFGMIRSGKNLSYLVELAKILKEKKSSQTIHIVGKNQTTDTIWHLRNEEEADEFAKQGYYTWKDNNQWKVKVDPELYALVIAAYPQKKEEIESLREKYKEDINGTFPRILEEKIKEYQSTLIPAIPLQFHINVSENEANQIFKQCKYSVLPAYRGATIRNTSMSVSLQSGLITLSHCSDITPSSFLAGGDYDGAFVLLYNTDQEVKKAGSLNYAEKAFSKIQEIEQNPEKAKEIYTAVKKVQQNIFDNIGGTFVNLYYRVLGKPVNLGSSPNSPVSTLSQSSSLGEISDNEIKIKNRPTTR